MALGNNSVIPSTPLPGYNNWAFEPILHQHFNRLRARLMNLAESSTRDRQQSDAMKGLMKDFVNEAYFPALRDMQSFLRDKGVISEREDHAVRSQSSLTAKSLNDVLYEPEA